MKQEKTTDKSIEKFLLRINKDVKDLAEKEAKIDNRSLNGHIVSLVENDLKQRGVL